MATYRVNNPNPNPNSATEPESVTQAEIPSRRGSENDGVTGPSREASTIAQPGTQAARDGAAAPEAAVNGAATTAAGAAAGKTADEKTTGTNAGTTKPVPFGQQKSLSTLSRIDQEELKGHWSRRKKIACGVCLFFLAALITVGVLIAFLVRTPTISYSSLDVVCPNNDYLRCAQDFVGLRVHLSVNNPNIIGATVNADLNLYKTNKQLLGPGYVADTDVGARSTTELIAVFNITSSQAYDVLYTLFVLEQPYNVIVEGRVFVHVGALRPSGTFSQTITIPAQSRSATLQSLGDALSGVDPTDAAGAVVGAAGSVGIPADTIAGAVGGTTGIGEIISNGGIGGSTIGGVTVPSSVGGVTIPHFYREMADAPTVSSAKFAQALLTIGFPRSEQRKRYVVQVRRKAASKLLQTKLAKHHSILRHAMSKGPMTR
jgi:hypothetical protein